MYYIGMFLLGLVVMYVPFAISLANARSTPGLRFLCAGMCSLNASLVTLCVLYESPTVLNILVYMAFILLSMDVALRKAPKDIDIVTE